MQGQIYACGDDQIREYTVTGDAAVETWRWRAADARDLPAIYRTRLLAHIDDCKPVDDGRAILVTASTGGVVLIDRATGHVRFRATAPMAHSADLLPGGHAAVALSINKNGDRLELYALSRNERPLASVSLPSGHGAVWDAGRQRLFALSHDLIQAFAFDSKAADPHLTETARWTLPGRHDGHDLSATPEGGYVVTTDDGVWLFDPDGGRFTPIPALNPKLRVKSVSVTRRAMAWVQAEDSWWAHGFTVADRDASAPQRIETPGLHLYKVRWIR
ncbi:lactonase family protein [Sphingomonas sp. A2-49]|uniref:lactonase family protein n=1 Tax=Sphingomonas sp. A2-49 TaxID=1391375 RepID=UPI0021CF764E|nr:lactonase family protein [Sphingomonas sp. A2-49]MCU6455554.1 lactonase family protein [Sphingomonas sp. A2-49]